MSETTPDPTTSQQSSEPSADGFDFASFSTDRLVELRAAFDTSRFPSERAALEQELARRNASTPTEDSTTAPLRFDVRFTTRDGLRGWLEARSSGQPLFGAGSAELQATTLVLSGSSRSWLGTTQPTEWPVDLVSITNVEADASRVQFGITDRGRRRLVALQLSDASQAQALAAALPRQLDPDWTEFTTFQRALLEQTPNTLVTTGLVAVNVLIYAALLALSLSPLQMYAFKVQQWGVNAGALTLNGDWWRLLTSLFLHANIPHVALNMWALWNVGRLCERLYGRVTFLALYLLCGVAASMASIVWDSNHFSLGASGAIFGLLGALLAFLTLNRHWVPARILRAHRWSTAVFIVANLAAGAVNFAVDNAAHVGGLVAGLLVGGVLAMRSSTATLGRLRPVPIAAAVALTALLLGAGQWSALGGATGAPESYRWLAAHRWYFDGEGASLINWNELNQGIASGAISRSVAAARFEHEVLPFWASASDRLALEKNDRVAGKLSAALAEFASARLDWVRLWISALNGTDEGSSSKLEAAIRATVVARAHFSYVSGHQSMLDRPHSWSDLPAVATLRSMLVLHPTQCISDPRLIAQPSDAAESSSDGPAQRHTLACKAQAAFRKAAYAELDATLVRDAAHLGDLGDGSSSFGADIAGLENFFEYGDADVGPLLVQLSNWHRAVPASVYPDLLEAALYRLSAWRIRGTGYADSVSNDQWSAFTERIEMAATAVAASDPAGRTSPLWFTLALETGLDKSIGLERLRVLYEDGAKRFPTTNDWTGPTCAR